MRFTYQPGAQPLDGYTIQRGIHRGGFGEVYFAHSVGGKEVALKLLHEQDFETELRGVSQCLNLKHPNLVNIFDLKTDAHGDHWVVMEYVSGSSLEDVLASFPNGLPLSEVREWLSGLVAGVAHLHDRGIVHRDLKPANVYRENGVVKVGDVGLSKRLDSHDRRQHTQSVGTVYYMAPEVAQGKYGPEVDVYSLGVMLYELITGKLPFTGETTAEILMKHLTAQPDLSSVPQSLRSTLARALDKDPNKRTPTVRALEQDFLRAMGDNSEPLTIPNSAFLPPPIPRTPNRGTTEGQAPWISVQVNRLLPVFQSPVSHLNVDPSLKPAWNLDIFNVFKPFAIFLPVFVLFIVFSRGIQVRWALIPWFVLLFVVFKHLFEKLQPAKSANQKSNTLPAATLERSPTDEASLPKKTRPENLSSSPNPIDLGSRGQNLQSSSVQTNLGRSIGSAGLVASILSLGVYFSLEVLQRSSIMPSIEHAALFMAVSIVGSWTLLIGHAVTMTASWTKRQHLIARLATGAFIGTCAFGFSQFFAVHTPSSAYTAHSAVYSIGPYPLIVSAIEPSWIGYIAFFAGWMVTRRRSRDMELNRKEWYSIFVTAGSVVMGYLISLLFAFPQWYAMLWAGTISTTLQLVSVWEPKPLSGRRS